MRVSVTATSTAPLSEALPLRRGLRAVMPGVAADMSRSIRQRTEGGRDVAGRPFRRKKDGSRSTLQDTGAMVKSLKPRQVTDRGFTLKPTGRRNERIAALAHQTGRRWVGASERQIDAAREKVTEAAIPRNRE